MLGVGLGNKFIIFNATESIRLPGTPAQAEGWREFWLGEPGLIYVPTLLNGM